ncbi:hypothetical protein EPI10_031901 [Gossypium australe]|uniref:Uncharacterized protein n=1 Tax=Gossypium australe TaxID=47621 RepID=A0A5B6X3F8_9ROSI|nr:hypothetical protein EPI10_031901 [Gossypium australe]
MVTVSLVTHKTILGEMGKNIKTIHVKKEVSKEVDEPIEEEEVEHHEPVEEKTELVSDSIISNSSTTKVPFSTRLDDKQKRDESLNVNLPLLELINRNPKYAKYLKEVMA